MLKQEGEFFLYAVAVKRVFVYAVAVRRVFYAEAGRRVCCML